MSWGLCFEVGFWDGALGGGRWSERLHSCGFVHDMIENETSLHTYVEPGSSSDVLLMLERLESIMHSDGSVATYL